MWHARLVVPDITSAHEGWSSYTRIPPEMWDYDTSSSTEGGISLSTVTSDSETPSVSDDVYTGAAVPPPPIPVHHGYCGRRRRRTDETGRMLTTLPFVYSRSGFLHGEDSSEDSDSQDATSIQLPTLCPSGPGRHRSPINFAHLALAITGSQMIDVRSAYMMTNAEDRQSDVDFDPEPQDPARPKCRCSCGCRRKPGRRIECRWCWLKVGPCCIDQYNNDSCHMCWLPYRDQDGND